jgi:hypothetical protein
MVVWPHPMRNAIWRADSPSTSYFCLRNASFLNCGRVQIDDFIVNLGEDSGVDQEVAWSTIFCSMSILGGHRTVFGKKIE